MKKDIKIPNSRQDRHSDVNKKEIKQVQPGSLMKIKEKLGDKESVLALCVFSETTKEKRYIENILDGVNSEPLNSFHHKWIIVGQEEKKLYIHSYFLRTKTYSIGLTLKGIIPEALRERAKISNISDVPEQKRKYFFDERLPEEYKTFKYASVMEYDYRKGDVLGFKEMGDYELLGQAFDLEIIEPQGRNEREGQE